MIYSISTIPGKGVCFSISDGISTSLRFYFDRYSDAEAALRNLIISRY
jgi:hypothetical protein